MKKMQDIKLYAVLFHFSKTYTHTAHTSGRIKKKRLKEQHRLEPVQLWEFGMLEELTI